MKCRAVDTANNPSLHVSEWTCSRISRGTLAKFTHISHHHEWLDESSWLQTRAPRAHFILLCTHCVKVVTNRHSFYRRLLMIFHYNAMLVLITVEFVTTPACFVNQLTRGYSYTLFEPNLFKWELVMELKGERGWVRGHRRGWHGL